MHYHDPEAIRKPPYHLTPELLWQAYEQLDRSKVRGAGAQKLLTDIISLTRFAAGKSDVLEPFPETVNQRFKRWRAEQERAGVRFTQAQLKRYRQSVLKAACEGKLVPTEAELAKGEGRAWEPADVLLERIKAERARMGKNKQESRVTKDL